MSLTAPSSPLAFFSQVHQGYDARASADPAVRALGFGGRTLRSLGWRYPRCWPAVDAAEEAVLRGMQATATAGRRAA